MSRGFVLSGPVSKERSVTYLNEDELWRVWDTHGQREHYLGDLADDLQRTSENEGEASEEVRRLGEVDDPDARDGEERGYGLGA